MKVCIVMLLCLFISLDSGIGSGNDTEIIIKEDYIFERQYPNIAIYLGLITNDTKLQYQSINEFKETLGYYESKCNYNIVNPIGFKGKYQFSSYMIKRFARVSNEEFLRSPIIQEKAMDSVCRYYLQYIIDHKYDRFVNREIDGVTVTIEGLMLGLHFSPLWLKWWLYSNGKINMSDKYPATENHPAYAGITMRDYMERFEKDGVVRKIYIVTVYPSAPC